MTSASPGRRPELLSSVATAARVLREFDRHATQLGITQLAVRVGAGKSTVHRVVWTLVEEGLLEKVEDTGLFRLTNVFRSLGASAETAQRLHEAATIPLDKLRTATRGTIQIAILDGNETLYVERREGSGTIPVFRSLGSRASPHVTASGKVLTAFLPREQQRRLVESLRFVRRTERTITSRTAFLHELALIRRRGYAENRGESEMFMCSVAAPVRDPLGRVVASVSAAEIVEDVGAGVTHLIGPVVETAGQMSTNLGWSAT